MSGKKRPGLLQGVWSFIKLALIVLFIRWIVFEIFVIPSGSMYPKLYVSDYIVVSKMDFGLRIPFTQKWLWGPELPKRGAVTVFKELEGSKFLIKRMIGKPGDHIEIVDDFIITLNSKPVEYRKIEGDEKKDLAKKMMFDEESFSAFWEKLPDAEEEHIVLSSAGALIPKDTSEDFLELKKEDYTVPEGHLLFLGDNRHHSFDGRRFGYMPVERLVGRSRYIVLSCNRKIVMNSGCDITSLRLNRLGNSISF